MAPLDLLKGCERHTHSGGGLYADDLLALGKDVYKEIEETFGGAAHRCRLIAGVG